MVHIYYFAKGMIYIVGFSYLFLETDNIYIYIHIGVWLIGYPVLHFFFFFLLQSIITTLIKSYELHKWAATIHIFIL